MSAAPPPRDRLALGINVPNFGPGTTPDRLADWARFAEDAGFDLAMVSDHVAVTPDVTEHYTAPFYDPFVTLAWLAGITARIELGTTVAVLPYRDPVLTARMTANIDQFSGGRLVLGVGAGGYPLEFEALGVSYGRRGAITDEHLAAILALWRDELVSFRGEHVAFRDVSSGPAPARSPHPPIWVGGSSPPAIRRAARFGDAWHPIYAELDWLRDEGLPALRAAAEAVGRATPAFAPRIRLHVVDRPLADADRHLGGGSLAQVVGDIGMLVDLGASHVVLDTNPVERLRRRPDDENLEMLAAVADAVR